MKLQRYDIYHEVDGDAFIVKECRDDGAHMDAGEALEIIAELKKALQDVYDEGDCVIMRRIIKRVLEKTE